MTNYLASSRVSRHDSTLILLVSTILTAAILTFMLIKPVKVLPYITEAPTYNLIDQNGQPISNLDLHGRVVLYDFIYTHCTTVCPAMTGQMLQIQRRLAEKGHLDSDVVLISITFDPLRDTPERLREYSAQMRTNPQGWLWLTGEEFAIKQLVGSGFGVYFEKIPLDESAAAAGLTAEQKATAYDFIHATVFILVDQQGIIRAEYHELVDVEQILRDIDLVVREKNARGVTRLLVQAAHLIKAYP